MPEMGGLLPEMAPFILFSFIMDSGKIICLLQTWTVRSCLQGSYFPALKISVQSTVWIFCYLQLKFSFSCFHAINETSRQLPAISSELWFFFSENLVVEHMFPQYLVPLQCASNFIAAWQWRVVGSRDLEFFRIRATCGLWATCYGRIRGVIEKWFFGGQQ